MSVHNVVHILFQLNSIQNNCSMWVLYSFDSGRSLLSTLLGQGDLSQLIAVVNGKNGGSTVKPFVLGFGW